MPGHGPPRDHSTCAILSRYFSLLSRKSPASGISPGSARLGLARKMSLSFSVTAKVEKGEVSGHGAGKRVRGFPVCSWRRAAFRGLTGEGWPCRQWNRSSFYAMCGEVTLHKKTSVSAAKVNAGSAACKDTRRSELPAAVYPQVFERLSSVVPITPLNGGYRDEDGLIWGGPARRVPARRSSLTKAGPSFSNRRDGPGVGS